MMNKPYSTQVEASGTPNSVTIHLSPGSVGLIQDAEKRSVSTTAELLTDPFEHKGFGDPIQSSFDGKLSHTNGFVCAVREAYSKHHHLTIRPEAIWLAILTQFSFYVNAHAEELRDALVNHAGRKELKLDYNGAVNKSTFDFAVFAKDMSRLLQENIHDLELRAWIIPAFSTTKPEDEVVASIIMMSTAQEYFEQKCHLRCGLPSVTLLGTIADYELISQRLEKLSSFGKEPSEFCSLLRPIVSHLIESFNHPESVDTAKFWMHVYSKEEQGSGPRHMSGWLTAFCFWNARASCNFGRTTK